MRKISEVLEEVVRQQPFLEEALYYGYLNLTAFAEHVRPHIERTTQKSVSVHAIKMALSRMDLPTTLRHSAAKRSSNRITTRANISIMSVVRSPKSIAVLTELLVSKKRGEDDFFTMIEGMNEMDIMYDTPLHDRLSSQIPQSLQILTIHELGICSIHLSDAEIYTPGLFYSVTKHLAFHGINIIQVLSTYHELGIIVREADLSRTVSALMD